MLPEAPSAERESRTRDFNLVAAIEVQKKIELLNCPLLQHYTCHHAFQFEYVLRLAQSFIPDTHLRLIHLPILLELHIPNPTMISLTLAAWLAATTFVNGALVQPSLPPYTAAMRRAGWTNLDSNAPPLGSVTRTDPGPDKTTNVSTAEAKAAAAGAYHLHQSNRGRSFYSNDNWHFWTRDDPTHGQVRFLSRSDAENQGLIGITEDDRAYASTSSGDIGRGKKRHSVRFHSKESYDSGLVIFDVTNMPVGCATWPALWTCNGVDWPVNGEIDVMEGVGYTSVGKNSNLMSVHLGQDAPLSTRDGTYTGTLNSNNCQTSYGMGNTGCSFRDSNDNGPSWGVDFNENNGGIWALQFGSDQGIKVWFWGRHSGKIPSELSHRLDSPSTLHPSTWGKPMANFQSDVINRRVLGQQIIMDITLAGDWAGNVAMDGDCGSNYRDAIAKGSNYQDAVFVFNGIDVYCPGSADGC